LRRSPELEAPAAAPRTTPVGVRTLVTVRELERHVRAGGTPVHVKGWMADWGALSGWDFDFFKDRYGLDRIAIAGGPRGERIEATIADYVDYILGRPGGAPLEAHERRLRADRPLYCLSYKPFRDHPELWDDCRVPPFLADWWPFFDGAFRATHFPKDQGWVFLSAKGATASLHQDSHHTITWLAQVRGRKRYLLYAPEQSERVYNGEVDPLGPDWDRHPRFREAEGQHCVLSPGEMLFLPPDWWHHAVSLEHSITVSCNFVNHTNFGDYLAAAFGPRLPEYLAALPAMPPPRSEE
jgi:Cupin-like domain